jgi:hypothetical protein
MGTLLFNDFSSGNSRKQFEFAGKMKPYLFISEICAFAIVLIGLYLRYSEIEIFTYFITIPLILLAIFYFFLGFAKYETDEKTYSKLLDFFVYISGWGKSAAIIGILYSIIHWPGDKMMLTVGMITLLFSLIVSLYYFLKNNKSEIFKMQEIIRSFIIISISAAAYFFEVLNY